MYTAITVNLLFLFNYNKAFLHSPVSLSLRKFCVANNDYHILKQGGVKIKPLHVSTLSPSQADIKSKEINQDIIKSIESEEINELTSENAKSYLSDGFVFGLDGSGLERPKGKVASLVVEGDDTKATPYQIGLVLSTFSVHILILMLNSSELLLLNGGNMVLTTIQWLITALTSWILADFGSGVLHWSVDNYGNGRTPIMGNIIAAFQGHHSAPWTITYRDFCNNIHKLCIPFGIPTILLINFISGPITTIFFGFFCMLEILSQEFHKWSHTSKAEVPDMINFLQKRGLIIGRVPHAKHHVAPYDGNYCIVSGVCNDKLDSLGFFRMLEHIVYNINGVESNAWKLDEKLKQRTLKGLYKLE